MSIQTRVQERRLRVVRKEAESNPEFAPRLSEFVALKRTVGRREIRFAAIQSQPQCRLDNFLCPRRRRRSTCFGG